MNEGKANAITQTLVCIHSAKFVKLAPVLTRVLPGYLQAMTSKAQTTSITTWLAELRMECYKKNLENYETIRVSLVCVYSWNNV